MLITDLKKKRKLLKSIINYYPVKEYTKFFAIMILYLKEVKL